MLRRPRYARRNYKPHIIESVGRIGTGVPAVHWFGILVIEAKEREFLPTVDRRRMSRDGGTYSHLRGATPISLDALGRRAQRWSLP